MTKPSFADVLALLRQRETDARDEYDRLDTLLRADRLTEVPALSAEETAQAVEQRTRAIVRWCAALAALNAVRGLAYDEQPV